MYRKLNLEFKLQKHIHLLLANEKPDEKYKHQLLSQYMFHLPKSTLGIYPKAGVAADAEPCAKIAR